MKGVEGEMILDDVVWYEVMDGWDGIIWNEIGFDEVWV